MARTVLLATAIGCWLCGVMPEARAAEPCVVSTRTMTGEQPKTLGFTFVSGDPTCRLTSATVNMGAGNTLGFTPGITCVPSGDAWTGGGSSTVGIAFHPPLAPGGGIVDCVTDNLGFYWGAAQTVTVQVSCASAPLAGAYTLNYDVTTFKTFKISEARMGGGCPARTCPSPSVDQADPDGDGLGNGCDNCPSVANPGQEDADNDGIGDACEPQCRDGIDNDGDGKIDYPNDTGCQSTEDNDEKENSTACAPLLFRFHLTNLYPLLLTTSSPPDPAKPPYIGIHPTILGQAKVAAFSYLLCFQPSTFSQFQHWFDPGFCLQDASSSGGLPRACPPLDCSIDQPGCMDPYVYRRVGISDEAAMAAALWQRGGLTEKALQAQLGALVTGGKITVDKAPPAKLRRLPLTRGLFYAGGALLLGLLGGMLVGRRRRPGA